MTLSIKRAPALLCTFFILFQISLSAATNITENSTQILPRSRQNREFFGVSDETKNIFPPEEPSFKFASSEENYQEPSNAENSQNSDEKLIDAVITAASTYKKTRNGRQLDLPHLDEAKLNELISDPAIKQELEAGNESEARGLIRDKLCSLGLMACKPHYGPPGHKKTHFGHGVNYKPRPVFQPPHPPQPIYNPGVNFDNYGTIGPKDVSLVQPVAVQPVGGPISAVPIQPQYNHHHNNHHHHPQPPIQPPFNPGFKNEPIYNGQAPPKYNYGPPQTQTYGPPQPPTYGPPKKIYPSTQIYSQPIIKPVVEKKIVEHVHHHVHHKGGNDPLPKETYGEYGVIGEISEGDYYGAPNKKIEKIANTQGKEIGVYAQAGNNLSPNYLGAPSHARSCICVPYDQCVLDGEEKKGEFLYSESRDVVKNGGIENNGLVGYGIDPRNKARSLNIDSNGTDSGENDDKNEDDTDFGGDDEIITTTLVPDVEVLNSTRVKREAEGKNNGTKNIQGRRLENSCRLRSIGHICCEPSRIRSNSHIGENSFNQQVLYNPNSLNGGFTPNNLPNDYLGSQFPTCGTRHAQTGINERVVTGGANKLNDGESDFGEYPWQVAILKRDGTFVCGGSLISASHVLTAAHAIKGLKSGDLRVRLGEWDVNHATEYYPHFERQVLSISTHPSFSPASLLNDLSVLRFEGSINPSTSPHISPVCLPPASSSVIYSNCWVTGWGKDSFGRGGKYQNVLKEIQLPVVGRGECENRLRNTRLGPSFKLGEGFLCAGGQVGRDACKGDGGGPLVCEMEGGVWAQAGIVSWGVGCGEKGVPGVYVDVGHYTNWIQQVMRA